MGSLDEARPGKVAVIMLILPYLTLSKVKRTIAAHVTFTIVSTASTLRLRHIEDRCQISAARLRNPARQT